MRPSIFGCTPWTFADLINDHVKPIPIPCTYSPEEALLFCTVMATVVQSLPGHRHHHHHPSNRFFFKNCHRTEVRCNTACTSFISLPGHSPLPLDSFYCCLSCNWKLYFDNLIIGYARFDPLCALGRHFWKALSTASTAGGLPGILRPRTDRGWCTQMCYQAVDDGRTGTDLRLYWLLLRLIKVPRP